MNTPEAPSQSTVKNLGTFYFERETKKTVLYKQGNNSQYVPKSTFKGQEYPNEVEVLVRYD